MKANNFSKVELIYSNKIEPENWNNTKLYLFTGGRYIESHDKEWVDIYEKIVSQNTSNLFDMNDKDDMYQYIMNQ